MENPTIGDVFMNGKYSKARVKTFLVVKDYFTSELIEYKCVAESIGGASNTFIIPFSFVIRNKIKE
jgi:hypothetical protein